MDTTKTPSDNELADFAKIAYDMAKEDLDRDKSSAWRNNIDDLATKATERQLVSSRSGHGSKIHGLNGSAPKAKGKVQYASVETWTGTSRPGTKVEVPIIRIQNVEIKPRMIHYTKVPCNIRVAHDKLQNQLDLADAHDIAEEERDQVREIVVNSEKEYLQAVERPKMMQVDEQLKDDQLFEEFVNVMSRFEGKGVSQTKRSHGESRNNKQEAGIKDVDESSVFHAIARFAPNLGFPFELRERYLRLRKSGESSKPSIPLHELKREDVMKPFHKNFCRRCFVYNCLLHDEIEKVGIERVRRTPEETDFSEDLFQPCSEFCYKHLIRNEIEDPALPLPDPHAEQCPSSREPVELDDSGAGNSSNGYESMLVDRNDDSDGSNGDSDDSIKVIKVIGASKNKSNQMPGNDTTLQKRTTDKRSRSPTSESYSADIENQHNSKHGTPSRKLSQDNLMAEKYCDVGNSSNRSDSVLVDRADDSDGSTGDSDDSIKVIKVLSASKNNSKQKPVNSTVLPKHPTIKRAKGINDSAISCDTHNNPTNDSDSADIENQYNRKNGSPSRKLSQNSLDEASRSIFVADMEIEETEGNDASKCHEKSWNYSEVSMYLAMQTLWPNRYCSMARAIGTKSCQEVYERSQSDDHKVMSPVDQPSGSRFEEKRTKKRDGMAQLRAFRQHCIKTNMILAKSKKPEVHPAYVPCHHPGLKCEAVNNCCCIIHKIPCEKFCSCTVDCVNLYPGCQCKSSCDSKHCDCVVGNRECDMDMCGCNLRKVLENPKHPCKNVNIQNRLEKKVKHMPSKVAGWGLFAAEPIKKDEYIGEYVGELISTTESELRGEIYDRMKSTFLFSKDDLTTIDGMRFGNSLRFINSSSSKDSANCFPVSTAVYGNLRIAFYASKNIAEDEELFFDYDNVINQQMGGNSSTAAATAATTSPTKRVAKKSCKEVSVSTSRKEIPSEKFGRRLQNESDDSDSDFA